MNEIKGNGNLTSIADFIWGIANKARAAYMPDKYGDVIIPMTIIRRFECMLENTKEAVVRRYEEDPNVPEEVLMKTAGRSFYNVSRFSLRELMNDYKHAASNFECYIDGFSKNVQGIFEALEMKKHIAKMEKEGCLYSIVEAFADLDLSEEAFASSEMGFIFENLIGRFYQNVDAGQFYTGRDIVKVLVSTVLAEGCEDLKKPGRVVTILDEAAATAGMLTTAYDVIKEMNETAHPYLYGQEIMPNSWAIGLAEMLIKGQEADNYKKADTLKESCFPNQPMRFVFENPPFGTPWAGANAKAGQEKAVFAEHEKGFEGRWGAGLPKGSDSQLLFLQSAVNKLNRTNGRCGIITNGGALYSGDVGSGESQIRRWLVEEDLIEAIIGMPPAMFYNTGIACFIWIISKNKRAERKGKIQLIDATEICHKLRKPLGEKKNEFTEEDMAKIVETYKSFEESEISRIVSGEDFLYREYTIMRPFRRSYGFSEERVENLLQGGYLNELWDETKVRALEEKKSDGKITKKESERLEKYQKTKSLYDAIVDRISTSGRDEKWNSRREFADTLTWTLERLAVDAKTFDKIMDGLSVMNDPDAEVLVETKGRNEGDIVYDKGTKDVERVWGTETVEDYMNREVLPFAPDAKWFFEENLGAKNPVIKVGAEIPFTKYFYKYEKPEESETLEKRFETLEAETSKTVCELFGRG